MVEDVTETSYVTPSLDSKLEQKI